ncbi:GGDEF domain-containing protein [Marinomonas transparens]|uniref:diguanylate cyclase n=1 Tax=Marinomonas transparens TaxID=2795388 RepID=A0A934MVW7_9GAMM|nr:GGDEF domain-containing protein [Marinomonas transparens]MBJ7537504.1 GGDEF domain-containing protein [Marinomonas transparens]
MTTLEAFFLNIALFSAFPLYITTMNTRLRSPALYSYMCLILLIGGISGTIYSFPLSDSLFISGGNLAYGAFMMTAVMLIISERSTATFRNIIRLVILIDFFIFVGFNFVAWLLSSGLVVNPLSIPSSIFTVSLEILFLGGGLILSEVLLMLFIFIQARKVTSKLSSLAFIYTLTFIGVLCLDGVLFPLIALNSNPELVAIIFGNVEGKAIMAACYSLPLLLFYAKSHKQFTRFVETPLAINELIRTPRKQLLDTLYQYEVRDQQLQQDKKELTERAEKDFLTGLANRWKFNQTFEKEWTSATQNQRPLTLVIGDIDFFKQYNDTYGHGEGDTCIKKVADLWNGITERTSGLAARIGGEEFAILIPDITPEQLLPRLQSFMAQLHEAAIPHSESTISPFVTMSIGAAGYTSNNESSLKDLYVTADKRLYKAKHNGRNQIVHE